MGGGTGTGGINPRNRPMPGSIGGVMPLFMLGHMHPSRFKPTVTPTLDPEFVASFNWPREIYADKHGMWTACVPNLDGCFAHGETHREALDNLDSFIIEWMRDALESGTPIPTPDLIR